MNKIAIVYWSGTGNTEQMARVISEGVKSAGGQAQLFTPGEFSAAQAAEYDVIAFGCPSMGAEQLEDSEFEPMFEGLESALNGKKVALFGSYGWGDGQWMRDWHARCSSDGANLFEAEGLIANEAPDSEAEAACRDMGKKLVAW